MPRRREIPKREPPPDPIYQSGLLTKFISTVMRDGKRSLAERILYDSLDIIKEPAVLKKHPGVLRTSGHVGFLGHGSRVEFRNISIKDLSGR